MFDCLILIEDNLEKYYKKDKNPKGIQLILDTLDNENISYILVNYKKIEIKRDNLIINNTKYPYPKAILSLIIPQPEDKHYKNIRLELEKHSKYINSYKKVELVKDKYKTIEFLKKNYPTLKHQKQYF